MEEVWRPVVGFEGLYEVSNFGRVRSLNYRRQKGNVQVLKPVSQNNGYLCVSFWDKSFGNRRPFSIHRMVAFAFQDICGKYFEGAVVNHKDENKLNNCVWNLEWVSSQYNTNYGTGKIRAVAKISKPIKMLSIEGEFIRQFHSANEAARFLGLRSVTHLTDCANGKTGHVTCKNCRWEWA